MPNKVSFMNDEMSMKSRDMLPQWGALQKYAQDLSLPDMKRMQQNNHAQKALQFELEGFCADFSSAIIDKEGMKMLEDLAKACDWQDARAALFGGERINNTEGRAVFHMALRASEGDDFVIDGVNVTPSVHDVLRRMYDFASMVREGRWYGETGKAISDVVNIGIGGSDLGPYMVYEALKSKADGPRVHFVSNVDGAHLEDTLSRLNPETTLFIVASKTFTTQETLLNAQSAKAWIYKAFGHVDTAIKRHFVAVSTNKEAVEAFGIDAQNMFPFWDWVGGRFSLWSAVGLSCVLAFGEQGFSMLLAGAHAMDEHFKKAPFSQNIPAIMALLGVFYRNFLGCTSLAVLPYAQRLVLLPAYLQQLEMESNGKSVDRAGMPLSYDTAPVLFGQPGTNGQHAFYQMLHQGREIIPCDFIAIENSDTAPAHHHVLLAHVKAQIEALREGQSYEQALKRYNGDELKARHSVFSGARPAHLFILPELDAYYLGMLLALYEHKVFMQGIIWNINSFDQWGVQLGKDLSQKYV